MRAIVFFIWSVGILNTAFAQDMNEGFKMLETGDFEKAESFFDQILTEFPGNKTAKICYGRAVGLSGNPNKALNIFSELDQTYPEDMEVLLNQAECYLWLKNSEPAVASYSEILKKDPTLFAALLGIANSYSMGLQYEEAYRYILKAEDIQPDNAQVALSKKYIVLGFSNKLASEDNSYEKALDLLSSNLIKNPQDQESLNLKATIHLIAGDFEDAQETYQKVTNPTDALIGQSVVLHLLDENKQALVIAKEALNTVNREDTIKLNRAQNNYVSALLWNSLIPEAKTYTDSMLLVQPNNKELILAQAQIAVYSSDYSMGRDKFNEYLGHDPKSFNANLGKADAQHALGMDNIAYVNAFKTLEIFPGQKDVSNFITGLNKTHSLSGSAKYMYGRASDGSESRGYQLSGQLGLSPLVSTQIIYQNKTLSSANGSTSSEETVSLLGSKRFNQTLRANASIDLSNFYYGEGQSNASRVNVDLSMDIRVSKSQNLTVGYLNEVQDFNEALLKQNLKIQHAVVKNSFFWKLKNMGWYTEAYRSYFSDGNKRNLVFTSLYKGLNGFKPIKFGTNYLFMNFSENKPTLYYSPKSYHQVEVFTELNFKESKSLPISISWSAALGYQIAGGQAQKTWRTRMELSRDVGRFNFQMAGGYSTIVAVQSNGFSYATLEGTVRFRIGKRPVFYRRIASVK